MFAPFFFDTHLRQLSRVPDQKSRSLSKQPDSQAYTRKSHTLSIRLIAGMCFSQLPPGSDPELTGMDGVKTEGQNTTTTLTFRYF